MIIRAAAQHGKHSPSWEGEREERQGTVEEQEACNVWAQYIMEGARIDNNMLRIWDLTQAGDRHQEHGHDTACEIGYILQAVFVSD